MLLSLAAFSLAAAPAVACAPLPEPELDCWSALVLVLLPLGEASAFEAPEEAPGEEEEAEEEEFLPRPSMFIAVELMVAMIFETGAN